MDEERVFDEIEEIVLDTSNWTATLIPQIPSLDEPRPMWMVSASRLVAADIDRLVYDKDYERGVVRIYSSKLPITCRVREETVLCKYELRDSSSRSRGGSVKEVSQG